MYKKTNRGYKKVRNEKVIAQINKGDEFGSGANVWDCHFVNPSTGAAYLKATFKTLREAKRYIDNP